MSFRGLLSECRAMWFTAMREGILVTLRLSLWRFPLASTIFQWLSFRTYSSSTVYRRLRAFDWSSLDHVKVSFVIPNNNGLAVGLGDLIGSIQHQTHKNIEIVVVDSGSTDDSISVLRQLGARVIEIAPEQFNHSYSRNRGASETSGEFIVFTVADALFDDPNWIRLNLALLEIYRAASLSTPQVPRGQASIHGQAVSALSDSRFRQSRGVTVTIPGRLPTSWVSGSIAATVYGVDDTNHLARASVFRQLKFRKSTVEDVDYGRRLYSAGHLLVLSSLTGIRHHHDVANRYKYFCRVFSDQQVMLRLIGGLSKTFDYNLVLSELPFLAARLVRWINQDHQSGVTGAESVREVAEVRKYLMLLSVRTAYMDSSVRRHSLEITEFLASVGMQGSRCDERPGLSELRFYGNQFRKELSATLGAIEQLGVSQLSAQELVDLVQLVVTNVVATSLAHLTLDPQSDSRVLNRLKAIRWM